MKKLDNQGSTLMIVIMTLCLLSILGIGILSLSIAGYKVNKTDSQIKTNFYFAESGLDEAYAIMSQLIEYGIQKGNRAAKEFIENLDLNQEKEKIVLGQKSEYFNEDGTINQKYIRIKKQECFENEYKEYITNELKKLEESPGEWHEQFKEDINEIQKKIKEEKHPTIIIKSNNIKFIQENEEKYLPIEIQSSYEENGIEKILVATYKITIPKYGENLYTMTNVSKQMIHIIWDKAITTDGNLDLANTQLNIDGDIYVRGENNGGVIVTGKNNNIKIHGNSYVKNLLTQKDSIDTNISINGSLFTLDDLEINGLRTNIDIKDGFYALSDSSDANKSNQSGSIIINTEDLGKKDGSSLSIKGDIMIHGSSFIDVMNNEGKKYQTGESISIKGNYKAYSYPIKNGERKKDGKIDSEESLSSDNVKFEYYDPLVVASKYGMKFGKEKDMLLQDKSDYFKCYYDEYGKDAGLSGEGIYLEPNEFIYSGAVIYKNGKDTIVKSGNIKVEDEAQKLNKKKDEFNKNTGYLEKNTDDFKQGIKRYIQFENLHNISFYEPEENKLIFLNKNNDIALIGKDGDSCAIPKGVQKINLESQEVNGIIISKGKLYMSGTIDFRGTIITGDDIIIHDKNKKTIIHDRHFLAQLIQNHMIFFDKIFDNQAYKEYYKDSIAYIDVELKGNIDEKIVQSGYMKDQYIQLMNWFFVK
ncbi:S-layer family protein [Inediibacterium massiliense]|uniref:S-layer family protein n=1 Tax=Inediibacterium massiliense TaxID=1658111 RepID=UPI0006B51840|nr:S-layer family protein [Inediibacterium massiliense]